MTWNLDPPPHFQGLDEHKRLTFYYRHLPHWRQPGATYFVTFRQADSLPQDKLQFLRVLKKRWEIRNAPPRSRSQYEDLWRESFRYIDRWLKQGFGSCVIKDHRALDILVKSLHHFDGQRYEIGCYCVMTNHVHLIVRPFDDDNQALARITHSWKRHTAQVINDMLGRADPLWQDESYDRIIRDEQHLWQVIQYIGRNLTELQRNHEPDRRWIRPEWKRLGWEFDRR